MQKAELVALTHILAEGKGQTVNIYTDSRYAFATAHVHRAIYRERVLLTAEGKDIRNKPQILKLLKAIWWPKRVAIMHCPGHQKGNSPEARGNHAADLAAREVALKKKSQN